MKLLLLCCFIAFVSNTLAAQLPDSATQGPNPQDIATPEPEYIDIDEPLPAGFSAPLPAPAPAPIALQSRSFSHYNIKPRPQAQPQPQAQASYVVPGHTFNSQTGYSYRRPVFYRRFYRRFY